MPCPASEAACPASSCRVRFTLSYQRRDTSSGDEAPDDFGGGRQRLRSKPAMYPVEALSAPRYFLPATSFAAAASCFCWAAALALTCFCAACLCTDFGDLSPIFTLPFFNGFLPVCVLSVVGYW